MKTLLLMASFWLQPPQELYYGPSVWFAYHEPMRDRTIYIKCEGEFTLTFRELCGDLNGDDKVDLNDFAILSREWKP